MKTIMLHASRRFTLPALTLGAIALSAAAARADIVTTMDAAIDSAVTGATTLLTTAVTVVALFLLWKLAKRAVNKA